MSLLLYIVFGGLVGWIASIIMKTEGQQGIVLDIIVGIVGVFLGSWIASVLGVESTKEFSFYGFFIALVGAVALLAVVKLLRRGTAAL